MVLTIRSISDIPATELAGKRALVRVDLNVPFFNGEISDDSRIVAVLPTIRFLMEHQAKIILMSHLGQPKSVSPEFSLRPVAERLQQLLQHPVQFVSDSIGDVVDAAVSTMQSGDVVMLENVRFHPGETTNDPAYAKALAKAGDLFVQDAVGTAHRAHASTAGVAD